MFHVVICVYVKPNSITMKTIYLIPVLAILTLNLSGQTHWVKHSGNPVMTAGPEAWEDTYIGPGSVIFHEGEYHMWYSGGHFPGAGNEDFKIGHATSPDGIKWTKDENPVLDKGADGEWDGRGVFAPSVLLRDDVFHMWFTGYTSDGIFHSVGYATSPDGINWVKDANNPVLEKGSSGEWDGNRLKAPSVVFDGSEYHMYFDAFRNSEGNSIGHATSTDGISWSKDPQNPILSSGGVGTWDYSTMELQSVLFHKTTFHMWYSGGKFLEWDIGYATSEDGSAWTKHDVNPVLLKGGAESWDAALVSMPTVIVDSCKFKMWYHGQRPDGTGGIGYAESDIGDPDICDPGVGINSNLSDQIRIYPNPAEDLINVQTSETGEYTIEISSVNGQAIQSINCSERICKMDLTSIHRGVYFITIRSKDFITTKKIIKL